MEEERETSEERKGKGKKKKGKIEKIELAILPICRSGGGLSGRSHDHKDERSGFHKGSRHKGYTV